MSDGKGTDLDADALSVLRDIATIGRGAALRPQIVRDLSDHQSLLRSSSLGRLLDLNLITQTPTGLGDGNVLVTITDKGWAALEPASRRWQPGTIQLITTVTHGDEHPFEILEEKEDGSRELFRATGLVYIVGRTEKGNLIIKRAKDGTPK